VAVVKAELIGPLAARESRRSMFSRVRPVPTARRVRVLDPAPLRDPKGATFVRFAIDTRVGFLPEEKPDGWEKGEETGCVYPESRQVFVHRGDRFYPGKVLLGERTAPAEPEICQPAPAVAERN
jgi:hypothetical protein